jgi:UDP-3-O-[3-hydroxymyristoyl] glucosamine N-acyltransferase
MSTLHTTGSIAAAVEGKLVGRADIGISGLAGLDEAGPGMLTFIRDRGFSHKWRDSKASAALVTEDVAVDGHDESSRALIYVKSADVAMLKILSALAWKAEVPATGVHPSAIVDPTAKIAATARVGPMCIVGARTVVSDGCVLVSRVTLGADVAIGPGSTLHPGVVIYDRCSIGAQTILHANVSIGADGFGYVPAPDGRGLLKVPHIGTVKIGSGVEIGANSCVDRGKFGATLIGDGAKIDNLVQVGHNVTIGRCAIVCGVTGIAGSVTVGEGAIIGGHVGVADGFTIGAGAKIGAKSGVMCDVPANETWTGVPAAPHREQMRTWSAVKKLPEVLRLLKKQGFEGPQGSHGFDGGHGCR